MNVLLYHKSYTLDTKVIQCISKCIQKCTLKWEIGLVTDFSWAWWLEGEWFHILKAWCIEHTVYIPVIPGTMSSVKMKKYLFMKQSTIIAVTKITRYPILIKTSKKFKPFIFWNQIIRSGLRGLVVLVRSEKLIGLRTNWFWSVDSCIRSWILKSNFFLNLLNRHVYSMFQHIFNVDKNHI